MFYVNCEWLYKIMRNSVLNYPFCSFYGSQHILWSCTYIFAFVYVFPLLVLINQIIHFWVVIKCVWYLNIVVYPKITMKWYILVKLALEAYPFFFNGLLPYNMFLFIACFCYIEISFTWKDDLYTYHDAAKEIFYTFKNLSICLQMIYYLGMEV